jgi:hypothetical protein
MLRWLLERSEVGPSYVIADKWPMIFGIKNEFAKRALSSMIMHGRKLVEESCRRKLINPSAHYITQVSSDRRWSTLLKRPKPLKTYLGIAIDCPAKIRELVRQKK